MKRLEFIVFVAKTRYFEIFIKNKNKLVSMGNSNYKNLTCDVLYKSILFFKKEVTSTEAE